MRLSRYQNVADVDLVALYSKGDEMAFEELFNRHWSTLYQAVFGVVKDKEVASDIVQEIFVKLWEKRNELQIRNMRQYLIGAARLKSFEYLRNGKIAQQHIERLQEVKEENTTEAWLNSKELQKTIERCVQQLPNKAKEVFKLSRFEHLSNREISSRLNISIKTVEGHITKALKSLSQEIDA